jgi:hypothetical protein
MESPVDFAIHLLLGLVSFPSPRIRYCNTCYPAPGTCKKGVHSVCCYLLP